MLSIVQGYSDIRVMKLNQPFRSLLLFLSICCFTLNSYGQDISKIDSLKLVWQNSTSNKQRFLINRALFDLEYAKDSALAANYINIADSLGDQLVDPETVGLRMLMKGKFYVNQGQYFQSISPLENSERILDSIGAEEDLLDALYWLGTGYRRTGNFTAAFERVSRLLELTKTLKPQNKKEIGRVYLLLGSIQGQANNISASNEYLTEAYKLFESIGAQSLLASTSNNLAINYKKTDEPELAERYYLKSLEIHKEKDEYESMAKTLSNMAIFYLKIEQLEKASSAVDQGLALSDKGLKKDQLAYLYQTKGRVLREQKQFDVSLDYLKRAEEMQISSGNNPALVGTYRYTAMTFAAAGSYKDALDYRLKYDDLAFKTYNLQRTKQLDQLESRYQNQLKQNQIELQEASINNLNKEVKIGRLQKSLYGLTSLLLLILTIFGGWTYRKRIKDKEKEYYKRQELQQQQLEFKHKELTSQMAHLSQKNSFIADIAESLDRVRGARDTFDKEYRRIERLIKQQRSTDADWEHFKQYFAEVHNDFEHKIRARAADITEKEIRLASFLRMNMTTKEIASILNVLPETVLKSKYRLKKKLGLGQDEDLQSYISTI